jgi:hypothetical protein
VFKPRAAQGTPAFWLSQRMVVLLSVSNHSRRTCWCDQCSFQTSTASRLLVVCISVFLSNIAWQCCFGRQEFKQKVRRAEPLWPESLVKLAAGALAMYATRLIDLTVREHVLLLWLIEGRDMLRAHRGSPIVIGTSKRSPWSYFFRMCVCAIAKLAPSKGSLPHAS